MPRTLLKLLWALSLSLALPGCPDNKPSPGAPPAAAATVLTLVNTHDARLSSRESLAANGWFHASASRLSAVESGTLVLTMHTETGETRELARLELDQANYRVTLGFGLEAVSPDSSQLVCSIVQEVEKQGALAQVCRKSSSLGDGFPNLQRRECRGRTFMSESVRVAFDQPVTWQHINAVLADVADLPEGTRFELDHSDPLHVTLKIDGRSVSVEDYAKYSFRPCFYAVNARFLPTDN